MKQITTIQFQARIPGEERPINGALNRSEIATDNMGNIPSIGDYVSFDNKDEMEVVYKVLSRYFIYNYKDDTGNWSIYANIVVERQSEDAYNKLIKN